MPDDRHDKNGKDELDRLIETAFGSSSAPHVSEESLLTEGSALTPREQQHVAHCGLCQSRRSLARDLMQLDAIGGPGDAGERTRQLVPTIESAVAAERSPSRLQVTMGRHSSLRVRGHDVEMRYRRQAATALRYSGEERKHHPISFRRRFGDLEVLLELTRDHDHPVSRFNLAVQLPEVRVDKTSVALCEKGRTIAVQPLRTGHSTFRSLPAGRYLLQIDEQNVRVSQFFLEVCNSEGEDE